MLFPKTLPALKPITILFGLYFVIWIPLEGNLAQAVLLGAWAALLTAAHLTQRYLGGRTLRRGRWLLFTAIFGLSLGFGSAILTLLAMVLKTGLHAHGPEFTPTEINWVLIQLPYWTTAGLLAGLALGLFSVDN